MSEEFVPIEGQFLRMLDRIASALERQTEIADAGIDLREILQNHLDQVNEMRKAEREADRREYEQREAARLRNTEEMYRRLQRVEEKTKHLEVN